MNWLRLIGLLLSVFSLGCNNSFVFESGGSDAVLMEDDTTSDAGASSDSDSDSDSDLDSDSDSDSHAAAIDTFVLFESGFEDGLPAQIDAHGDVSVDTNTVNDGANAMRVAVDGTQISAGFEIDFTPISSGSLYYRAYYFVSTPPADQSVNVMELRDGDWNNVLDINLDAWFAVGTYFFADEAANFSERGIIPVGEWFCLLARIDISSTTGGAEVWIDGVSVLSTGDAVNSLPDGGISIMRFGILYSYPESGDVELFVDDVVLSVAPVGC